MSVVYKYDYISNGEADVIEITEDLQGNKTEREYNIKYTDETNDNVKNQAIEFLKHRKEMLEK